MSKILSLIRLFKLLLPVLLILICFQACQEQPENIKGQPIIENTATEALKTTMQKHLDAVSNRDLLRLQSTLSPAGDMQLILPGNEIIHGTDGFMEFHREWFKDTTWTFETKILDVEAGSKMGMAVTEVIYREPERNGIPYFNRMIVSYDLKKIDGSWYVIKDHASSVEKSTDE